MVTTTSCSETSTEVLGPSPRALANIRVYRNEIIGPVMYVAPVPDLSAALALVDAQTTCYQRADTPALAIAMHTRTPGARSIAGGTNLVDLMKLQIEAPEHLIDISHLPLATPIRTSGRNAKSLRPDRSRAAIAAAERLE